MIKPETRIVISSNKGGKLDQEKLYMGIPILSEMFY